MTRRFVLGLVLVVVGPLAAAWAGPLPENFTLAQYVPDSCAIYVHQVHNPKRADIDEYWGRVHAVLRQVGLEDEVRYLVAESLEGADRQTFERLWTPGVELAKAVSWSDLTAQETVVAVQVAPLPSVVVLCHGKAGTGRANLAALAALLEHIASSDAGLTVSKGSYGGTTTSSLAFPHAPISLELFGQGDVIGMSTSSLLAGEVASLMAGAPTAVKPITEAPRFRQGIAPLPAPADAVFFVDWRSLLDGLKRLIGTAGGQADDLPKRVEVFAVLAGLLDRLDVLDYTVGVQWTEGPRESFSSITTLQPEAKDKLLAKVKAFRSPLQDPLSMVPVEAGGFHASAGLDFAALYSFIVHLIGEDLPDGQVALVQWMALQDKIGFDLEQDLLSWISGEYVTISMPATVPTPFWTSDLVIMLRVSDAELAARKLDAGIGRLQAFFRDRLGQSLMVAPAAGVRAKGFQGVSTPLFAMLPCLTIGLHDNWLIVGTSETAINLCLATAAGEHPSVVQSARFQAEGVLPTGPVQSVSFADLTGRGPGVAQALLSAGMFAGMMPDNPETRPLKGMIRVLTRLQPVFNQIDFLSSSATVTTFDGLAWRTDGVVTYRVPAPGVR